MSANKLEATVAVPYARALFDYSVEKNIMHQLTADFQNLTTFLHESSGVELTDYLNNPIVKHEAKREILAKVLKSQINTETFKFLMVLIDRDRINLLQAILDNYLEIIYQTANIKLVEVSTASRFNKKQKNKLIQKLKELTKAREIRLVIITDPSLIGGFLIKTESKVLDFTVKNQLKQLAKHLDTVLEF